MRLNDEMQTLIKHELNCFVHRAIAREIVDMLLDPKSPGECPLKIQAWVDDWHVDAQEIWHVIDLMTAKDLWQIEQGRFDDVLRSGQIKSSASAIKKKGKRLDMNQIRKAAQTDRSNDLGLGDVGPSAVSEICRRIPLLERNTAMLEGYQGWFPTDRYGLDGTVYVVTEGMLTQWQKEFPGINMQVSLDLMFDDLKMERMERPKPATFPYWVTNWLKKNGAAAVLSLEDEVVVDESFEVDY